MAVRYTGLEIANHLIEKALVEGKPLTNMKLQKLMYFANGEHLAVAREPLFSSPIEARQYGPVIPLVDDHFKQHGAEPIHEKARQYDMSGRVEEWKSWVPEMPIDYASDRDRKLLNSIWERYGRMSEAELMQEVHRRNGPFYVTRERGLSNSQIPKERMFEFFSQETGR